MVSRICAHVWGCKRDHPGTCIPSDQGLRDDLHSLKRRLYRVVLPSVRTKVSLGFLWFFGLGFGLLEKPVIFTAESKMVVNTFMLYTLLFGLATYFYVVFSAIALISLGRDIIPVLVCGPLFIILPNLTRVGFETHWPLGALGIIAMTVLVSWLLYKYTDWGNAVFKAMFQRLRKNAPVWKDWAGMALEDAGIWLKVHVSAWIDRIALLRGRK